MKRFIRIFPLVIATLLICCSTQLTFAQTIHVVIAGNHTPNSTEFNQSVDADVTAVKAFFKANVASDNLKMVEIDPEKITPQLVVDTIATLQPAVDDTVVFYYSGAGETDPNAGGNYMTFTNDKGEISTLSRKQVKDCLKDKKAHLNILLTDTSNSFEARKNPADVKGTALDKLSFVLNGKEAQNAPIINELFIKPTGTVDLITAQFGQFAFTLKAGSIGTSALIDTLKKLNKDLVDKAIESLTWSEFLAEFKIDATLKFKKAYPEGNNGQKTQTPFAFELPTSPRIGVRVISLPEGNVQITEIMPNSPGHKAGLRVKDVIVNINGEDIKNETDYSQCVDKSPKKMTILIKGIDTPFRVIIE